MAVEHWVPEIGFWWNGVFFVLLFVPLMIFVGKKLRLKIDAKNDAGNNFKHHDK